MLNSAEVTRGLVEVLREFAPLAAGPDEPDDVAVAVGGETVMMTATAAAWLHEEVQGTIDRIRGLWEGLEDDRW